MKYKIEIKWGLIFFVVTLCWILFEKAMGWHGDNISQHAKYSIIYDAVFISIYSLAFWNKKKQVLPGAFTWGRGFKFGAALTGMVTALSPLVQIIMHKLISPAFFPNVIKLAVENNLLTQSAAEKQFNLGNYIIENIIGTFALGILCSLILAIIFKTKASGNKIEV
jgi:hypothetical protein